MQLRGETHGMAKIKTKMPKRDQENAMETEAEGAS